MQAAGEGVFEGIKSSATGIFQTLRHPIQSFKNLWGTAKTAATLAKNVTCELIELSILTEVDPKAAEAKIQGWKDKFWELANMLGKKWQETEGREITKAVFKFGTKFLINKGCSYYVGKMSQSLRPAVVGVVKKGKKFRKPSRKSPALGRRVKGSREVVNRTKRVAPKKRVKPLGKGNTGRTIAKSEYERQVMKVVKNNPHGGRVLDNINMNDSRWPAKEGWVKMEKIFQHGKMKSTIHYVWKQGTDIFDDFKYK